MPEPVPINQQSASPVFDLETEQALLGALLISNDVLDAVDLLEPRHFFEPLHQRIFEQIVKLVRAGRVASPASLRSWGALDAGITELGGVAYFGTLCEFTPSIRDAPNFAGVIRDLFLRRELLRIGSEIRATAYDPPIDMTPSAQVEAAEAELVKIVQSSERAGEGLVGAAEIADRVIERAERAYQNPLRIGLSTGLTSLDEAMGLMMPGDLIVLGGAPSSGKTALAQQIAWYRAKLMSNVAAWSLEMTSEEYMNRHIAQLTGVPATRIDYGKVTDIEIARIVQAREAFADAQLSVDDGTSGMTIAKIRSRARRLHKRKKIDLIVIDHLRFVQPADPRALERDQVQQMTKDCKTLAKELELPVLLISHVNREYNKRENKRPRMSDLYGGSAIEQNADVVLFVHREHYWLRKERPPKEDEKATAEWIAKMQGAQGKADLIVEKRRRGPVGDARVAFHDDMTLFAELDAEVTVPGRLL